MTNCWPALICSTMCRNKRSLLTRRANSLFKSIQLMRLTIKTAKRGSFGAISLRSTTISRINGQLWQISCFRRTIPSTIQAVRTVNQSIKMVLLLLLTSRYEDRSQRGDRPRLLRFRVSNRQAELKKWCKTLYEDL